MNGKDRCPKCNGVGYQNIGGEWIRCPCCKKDVRNEKSKALVSEPGEYLEVR